jgi:hypothetical protein
MVYRFLMYLSCFAPLTGIWLMERGEFGRSIDEFGYPNGATLAFIFYLLVCFGVIVLVTRGTFFSNRVEGESLGARGVNDVDFSPLGTRSLFLMLLFLLFTVFFMGGHTVLSGSIGKGEFRSNLGGQGAIGYLILKYYAPAVFAFACIKFSRSQKLVKDRLLLAAIAGCLVLLAMSWGFKSGGILALLPGGVVIFWDAKPAKVLLFAVGSGFFLIFSYWFFDAHANFDLLNALEFLFVRLTILQGDVAWKMWDLYASNAEFPNYFVTLLPAVGDRLFSLLTGITIEQPYEWVMTHFGLLLTNLAGYPIHGILAGHNVTGTPFSEGIIAGGFVGIGVFGMLAGAVIGIVYLVLRHALAHGHDKIAATVACYSIMGVMAWIIGGSIVSLFHVSVIFGVLTNVLLLYFLEHPPMRFNFKVKHGRHYM